VDAGAGETGTGAGIQVVAIGELVDTNLADAQKFQGRVNISTPGADGTEVSSVFDTASSPRANLELLGGKSAWVTVTPLSSSQDLVTLQNIDTTQIPPELTLYLANSSMVEEILAHNVFTQDLKTDPAAAQVLVSFVNAKKVGVQHVAVTLLTTTPILYAADGSWSDTSGETDLTGQVLLINMPVSDGGVASLAYTAPASDAGGPVEVVFPVAAGAVTLLTVVI
jgi:hypothetical protein